MSAPPLMIDLTKDNGEFWTMARLEERIIRQAVAWHNGNVSAAAKALGIGRSTLYRKVKP